MPFGIREHRIDDLAGVLIHNCKSRDLPAFALGNIRHGEFVVANPLVVLALDIALLR